MDIQVSCEQFQKFIKRCYCGGLIKDLVLQASDGQLLSKFATKAKDFYAEVYLENVDVIEEGVIKIPNLKKILDVISRIESDYIKIKSNEEVFIITDGSGVGKLRVSMLQTSEAEIIESFHDIKNLGKMFDTEKLHYVIADINYENGCEITHGAISEILKDAKAFGYEIYNFKTKELKRKNKGKTMQLRCCIVNQHTTEKLQRVISEDNFLGDPGEIPECILGKGFREILDGICGEDKEMVQFYFTENSCLLTDGKSYFYNLHTLEE